MKQIALPTQASEGAIVVDKVNTLTKVGWHDAATETYGDMIANGIVDPTKMRDRSALQNAASVTSMVPDHREPGC